MAFDNISAMEPTPRICSVLVAFVEGQDLPGRPTCPRSRQEVAFAEHGHGNDCRVSGLEDVLRLPKLGCAEVRCLFRILMRTMLGLGEGCRTSYWVSAEG